jgi:diguanylate cyclase (GGDEF)-like protein
MRQTLSFAKASVRMSEQKILLVQAENSPLAELKKALSSNGFQVTTCTSGFDALDELRTEPGDLVLSAVGLPDINGFQLCSLIKSAEQTNSIPVVVVGNSEELDDGFWQRAASSDLVLPRKEAESDGDKVVEQIKQLLLIAKGGHKKAMAETPLIPANLNSKDLIQSYQKLLATLLMERSAAHLARTLVEAVSSRVQFMLRFSGYMQRIFNAEATGLIVVDPKAHWAIYDALVPISKASLEKLQASANKDIGLDGDVRTIVSGETPPRGATIKSHEVVMVSDEHNSLIGALVLGWSSKPTLTDELRANLEIMRMHMRPVFKALFDLQQIQMLKQHHAFGSYVDPVTGLYNIEFLIGFLQQQLLFSKRQKLPTGLILIDVDRFSDLNEQFGAETGDMVLMSIGHKLSRTIRQSDLLARYSGDTFSVVLPNTDLPGSKVVAEKLRHEIESMTWDAVGGKAISVTVCVGCSAFNFEDSNPETILRDAKIALMDAKEEGRNRIAP